VPPAKTPTIPFRIADGRFDRTRDFVLTRGENQFAVSMPEIRATVFPMEFGQDGLPYARAFPIDQLAILKDDLAKRKLVGIYDRETDLPDTA
jgi:hypothetical protein